MSGIYFDGYPTLEEVVSQIEKGEPSKKNEEEEILKSFYDKHSRSKKEVISDYNERLYKIWVNQISEKIPSRKRRQALNYLLGRVDANAN